MDKSVSISALCRRTGVSRQAYYQHHRRVKNRRKTEQQVLELVRRERRVNPRMGTRKLHYKLTPELNKQGVSIGRDALFDLLSRKGMLVAPRKSRGPRTTDGAATWWKNILKETPIDGPDQGWVADISYIYTLDGFCYMALISDVYSRKIVGWDVSESLELEGALRALNMALQGLPKKATPMHHSDRGSQYRSKTYTNRLLSQGCSISMTEDDHCAENAQAERMNGILKQEYYLDVVFNNTGQARRAVGAAIRLYNQERPHLNLQYRTPEMVHRVA